MRPMQDPILRHHALVLYRQGKKHLEVAKAIGVSRATMKREEKLDPAWAREIQEAMGNAFEPVIEKAIELALKADESGDNEGSLKAMDMVFRHYGKVLTFEHDDDQLDRKIEAQAEIGNRPAVPVLTNPEAVREFMALMSGEEEEEVIDAEVIEE